MAKKTKKRKAVKKPRSREPLPAPSLQPVEAAPPPLVSAKPPELPARLELFPPERKKLSAEEHASMEKLGLVVVRSTPVAIFFLAFLLILGVPWGFASGLGVLAWIALTVAVLLHEKRR